MAANSTGKYLVKEVFRPDKIGFLKDVYERRKNAQYFQKRFYQIKCVMRRRGNSFVLPAEYPEQQENEYPLYRSLRYRVARLLSGVS